MAQSISFSTTFTPLDLAVCSYRINAIFIVANSCFRPGADPSLGLLARSILDLLWRFALALYSDPINCNFDRDNEPGKTDVFVMTAEGESARKIIANPAKDTYPFMSPNGKYLYCTSYRSPQGVYRFFLDDDFSCRQIKETN